MNRLGFAVLVLIGICSAQVALAEGRAETHAPEAVPAEANDSSRVSEGSLTDEHQTRQQPATEIVIPDNERTTDHVASGGENSATKHLSPEEHPPSSEHEEGSSGELSAAGHASSDGHAPAAQHEAGGETAAEKPVADGEPIVRPEPDDRERELITTIKMLYAAQDAVAAGHEGAKSLQASLLSLIASRNYAERRMTGSPHLASYLAGYLLSGGDPNLVESLIASSQFDEAPGALLRGCVLYRRGKRDDALKAFETVDLSTLAAPVLGRVALARAVLTPELTARERLLAVAIASMPGTLVEEGALRRSALGFSEIGDHTNFWRRVDRYTRRFPHSGYLPDFIQQVASAAARMAQNDKRIDVDEMDRSLSRLNQSERQRVFIALARLGSSRHMVDLIGYASGRLGRIAVPGSQEEQVAQLYYNAYRLLDDETGAPRRALKSFAPATLPEHERRLLEAALAVSSEIDAPLDDGITSESTVATPLTNRAESVMKNADKLLQEPM